MKSWLHNFICGAGTLLEIMPPVPGESFPRTKKILARTNAEAIYGDWEKIGADFRAALGHVDKEIHGNGNGSAQSSPPAAAEASSASSKR